MKIKSETKIVIIGMGALMKYIKPCYEEYIGKENLKSNIAAVKGRKNIEQIRREFPFEIRLYDNLSALRDMNPDMILFAPPPTLVPQLTNEVLKVYYQELRQKNMPLPDLYAFAPSPVGDYYLHEIGDDINVCNILPNLFYAKGGNTFITYPNTKQWPLQNKERIEEFFKPLGGIIEVKPECVLHMLASMVTVEIIKVSLFTVAGALEKMGEQVNYKDLAAYLRAYHAQQHDYSPQIRITFLEKPLNKEMQLVLEQFYNAWFKGIHDYLISTGMQKDKAEKILIESIDLNLYVCQNEEKDLIEQSIKDHATKGGVLERGCLCFNTLMKEKLIAVFSDQDQDKYNSKFFAWTCHSYNTICKIVALHCERLSGIEPAFKFSEEVFAVTLLLFVKNLIRSVGENDTELDIAEIQFSFNKITAGMVTSWKKYGLLDEGEYYLNHLGGAVVNENVTFTDWENMTGSIAAEMSQKMKEVMDNADDVIDRTYKDIEIIFGTTAATLIRENSKVIH